MKTELGGDRLGSGNKQEISMKNYERSSHDLGYVWRSSMASGTLVPFMSELALPGDSFDVNLNCDVKTLPTIGPLFGSYKVQLDVFQCPVRLYQGKLHMNMLNIGMDMSEVKLPQIFMAADYTNGGGDNQQINPSSIFSYLNMRGLGRAEFGTGYVERKFSALSYLSYWDIYKNYYANKQEERGVVIHGTDTANQFDVVDSILEIDGNATALQSYNIYGTAATADTQDQNGQLAVVELRSRVRWNNVGTPYGEPDPSALVISIGGVISLITDMFSSVVVVQVGTTGNVWQIIATGYRGQRIAKQSWLWASTQFEVANVLPEGAGEPQLVEFPLDNIDDMRMQILEDVRSATAFEITPVTNAPYGLSLGKSSSDFWYKTGSQEGLGIKTYQSDLFNNWISTEWIDGTNGINEVTAVSTAGDEFTIDSLNLANKVYNMLNRIAISGGSYDDWLDAVYTHERAKSHENPIYQGSLIKELGFEEVISNAETKQEGDDAQPLGTLAGRGKLSGKNKGGRMKIKVNEPSYIMGIVSITPRLDYSQGNKWDTSLKTMNDFHKPALDEIGFQDLVTDQMAWFDTEIDQGIVSYKSAGKQPAWINYMTNVNQTRGNFAEENSMFMTLNRRYDEDPLGSGMTDLTTYVDPSKFNNIFAQESLDSQNFWVQIGVDLFARRKMSAKVIPNL